MSSRGGARPDGTDGNDFMHREKVASRYLISSQAKSFVKFSIFMNIMLSVLVILQLTTYHLRFNYPTVDIFPKPQKWEYIWILCLIPAIIGYISLFRNRLALLNVYYYGSILFGLGPVICTMIFSANDLWEYVENKTTDNLFNGFPVIVLWYIFLFIAIQIHAFGIYYASVLRHAWKDSSKKKN